MLGTLQSIWAPEAFIVSFKLETDEQILISKVSYLRMKLVRIFNAQENEFKFRHASSCSTVYDAAGITFNQELQGQCSGSKHFGDQNEPSVNS